MEQAQEEKHIIWSNLNLDMEDWREFLEEEYPGRTEEEYYGLMHELNNGYLDDERMNLDRQLSTPILVCADLGLWNGRKSGYRMIGSGNIKDCLDSGFANAEWYVDRQGDLRSTAVHHDGRNHYLYRAVRERVPDWKVERLQNRLYEGTASYADIAKVTRRLGDEIAAVYGFPIQEENRETGGMTVMEAVDVKKEMLEEVELLGRTGYFTELRVDKETVPEGMHCYELRHGDDDGFPASVEESVRVNYFGAVLFTEALELGEEKALQIGYEDFTFTGEQMYLAQVQKQQPDRQQEEQRDTDGHVPLNTGRELLKFMEENGISFPMNEKEADLVCGYMEGHGNVVGHKDGQLCRGDLCVELDRTVWEETTIDDLVDSATEWNYELLQEAREFMEHPKDFRDFVFQHSRYEELCADEKVLDAMFDRTKYGEQLEHAAEMLAEQLIQNLQSKGDIDGAVKELVQGVKGGQAETAVKQEEKRKGRSR